MRVLLLSALSALLCGCASYEAANGGSCRTLASGDETCLIKVGQPIKLDNSRAAQDELREAANGRVSVKGSPDALAPAAAPPGELIPRGSLEEFKFCTTIFQTPFDQFTCLKDLQNR